eukprot:TRINITY_DN11893_c0_g5_i1.p2 TRINITY_DN11893_c0_g5~~TRINITY_DN11893_c0_g5_i1.p2  ORF type:complete len:293 (+),score=50.72 TRINITY_DN11893_c0_g5_i1:1492-2370(+)
MRAVIEQGGEVPSDARPKLVNTFGNCVSVWELDGKKTVFKVYDCSASGRKPIDRDLLEILKEQHDFYKTWKQYTLAHGIYVVAYSYLDDKESWTAADWKAILQVYDAAFMSNGWVHGDVLRRNMLPGLPLDFDFAGVEDTARYSARYNRHPSYQGARAGELIKHAHDLYSFGRAMIQGSTASQHPKQVRAAGIHLKNLCEGDATNDEAAKALARAIQLLSPDGSDDSSMAEQVSQEATEMTEEASQTSHPMTRRSQSSSVERSTKPSTPSSTASAELEKEQDQQTNSKTDAR